MPETVDRMEARMTPNDDIDQANEAAMDEFARFKPVRDYLTTLMNTLSFVTWDRLVIGDDAVNVYGWIPREDGRSDFVLIRQPLDLAVTGSVLTSSARLDPVIMALLNPGGVNGEPSVCRRVEFWMQDVEYATRESQ